MTIAVNVRALAQPVTGVQRYTHEIIDLLGNELSQIAPNKPRAGIEGHMWEQFWLPFLLKDRLLWSPCNTGPLMVEHQVVTIHDISPIDHPEWMSRKFASWYQFMTPRLARRVRRIITDSEFTKERLIDVTGVESGKIVVVPLGVDKRFCPVNDDMKRHTIATLGLPSATYILSLGSLEPRKNLFRLLEAWRRIEAKVPKDIWLFIAGAKGNVSVFNDVKLDVISSRVHFLGRIEDRYLPALYSGALAFVYMSEYEGFGLPPLEAMACGAPVITSNTTALPEVVGEAGLMVSPYDVDAIAEAMLKLIGDSELQSTLKQKGIERARAYTWRRTAELTRQVLQAEIEAVR